jgi:CheY-like chemotaxis protein
LNKSSPDALPGNWLRVPVHEDEVLVSLSLTEVLNDLRYQFTDCAVSPRGALQVTASTPEELATADFHLASECDGIEVATELRELYALPALLMTGAPWQSSNDVSLMRDLWTT